MKAMKIEAYKCSDNSIHENQEDANRHELALQLERWHGSELKKAFLVAKGQEFPSNLERFSAADLEIFLKFYPALNKAIQSVRAGKRGNVVKLGAA